MESSINSCSSLQTLEDIIYKLVLVNNLQDLGPLSLDAFCLFLEAWLKPLLSIEVQLTAAVRDFRERHNKIENCLLVWTQTRKNAQFATDQLGYALQNRSCELY